MLPWNRALPLHRGPACCPLSPFHQERSVVTGVSCASRICRLGPSLCRSGEPSNLDVVTSSEATQWPGKSQLSFWAPMMKTSPQAGAMELLPARGSSLSCSPSLTLGLGRPEESWRVGPAFPAPFVTWDCSHPVASAQEATEGQQRGTWQSRPTNSSEPCLLFQSQSSPPLAVCHRPRCREDTPTAVPVVGGTCRSP